MYEWYLNLQVYAQFWFENKIYVQTKVVFANEREEVKGTSIDQLFVLLDWMKYIGYFLTKRNVIFLFFLIFTI